MTGERRHHFRTRGRDTVAGLIRNFELNMLPGNQAVCEDFGINGDDYEAKFDALRTLWERGDLERARLTELRQDGRALTRLVQGMDGGPADLEFVTMGELLRELKRVRQPWLFDEEEESD